MDPQQQQIVTTVVPFASSPPPPPEQTENSGRTSYEDMILHALEGLSHADGSSKKAISKFIEDNYENLPVEHSVLLGHYLREMKMRGTLLLVRRSYKIADNDNVGAVGIGESSGAGSFTVCTRFSGSMAGGSCDGAGRVRPPSVANVGAAPVTVGSEFSGSMAGGSGDVARRGPGRGRPPVVANVKAAPVTVGSEFSGGMAGGSGDGARRGPGRGRPPVAANVGTGRMAGESGDGVKSGPGRGRGRGRPPMVANVGAGSVTVGPEFSAGIAGGSGDGEKRGPSRGRPPMVANVGVGGAVASPAAASPASASASASVALRLAEEPKSRRGRPRKIDDGAGSSAAVGVSIEKRRPGRATGDGSASAKLKTVEPAHGRPIQAQVAPVLIPYAPESLLAGDGFVDLPSAGVSVASGEVPAPSIGVSNVGSTVVRKRKGRPRMEIVGTSANASDGVKAGTRAGAEAGAGLEAGAGTDSVAGAVVGSVRQGRLGMDAGAAGTLEKSRGKTPASASVQNPGKRAGPVGRPRKNAAAATGTGSSQAANEDLAEKLEFIQNRIRESLVQLRPHVSSGQSMEAVAALQLLEGLAALDVSAPFGDEPPGSEE